MRTPRALAIVAAGVVAFGAGAAAEPRGKIVRVERVGARTGAIRFCVAQATEIQCFGETAPVRGDTVAIIDENHKLFDRRIASVMPIKDGCNVAWKVTYDGVYDVDRTQFGVIGAGVSERGHMVRDAATTKISGTAPGEMVILALDRDGDNTVDVAVSYFSCDSQGQVSTSGPEICINLYKVEQPSNAFTRAATLSNLNACFR